VDRERFLERRQLVFKVLASAFSADCVILAPAQVEAWKDAQTGLYLYGAPSEGALAARPERWTLEVLPYEQCLADLLAAVDLVRSRNPAAKVMIATSPEPLEATFTGEDVRLAHTEGKAVLRAVCGAVAAARPMTDYLPVYEAAVLSHPKLVWEPDRQRLSAGFLAKIARRVQDLYLRQGEQAEAPPAAVAAPSKSARALLAKRKYAEAEEAARAALKDSPDDLESGMILVEALIGRFRGDDAERELKTWLERYPDRADLRIALARAWARSDRGRLPEAIIEINSAARMDSMGMTEFRAINELIRRKAPPIMAEAIMRRAVERFPEDPEAHGFLVDVLVDRVKYKDATEQLRLALQLPGAPSLMRLQLAALLIEAGEREEPEALIRGVLSEEPDNPDARTLLESLAPAPVSR
jgi:tetratricopeptide (TPR) repeat protein